jgi:hypothetical protein
MVYNLLLLLLMMMMMAIFNFWGAFFNGYEKCFGSRDKSFECLEYKFVRNVLVFKMN